MNASITCPGCGGALTIASSATVFVVCSYCRSTLIHDKDWKLHGKVAELPPEVTYLQLGTKGKYEGESFELIGRRRLRWDDGFWTEWCALFPKGKIAWLAEAQGTFALGFEIPPPEPLPVLKGRRAGTQISFVKYGIYTVDDCKEAEVIGTEGEMPYLVQPGQKLVCLDGSNATGGFCSVELELNTGDWSAFLGKYQDFDAFQFQNLRQLDGW